MAELDKFLRLKYFKARYILPLPNKITLVYAILNMQHTLECSI